MFLDSYRVEQRIFLNENFNWDEGIEPLYINRRESSIEIQQRPKTDHFLLFDRLTFSEAPDTTLNSSPRPMRTAIFASEQLGS
jgi:hypothetical protein